MSPEQAKGFEADHRSDLFSVGCILYELLTGRQAFGGETASDILASVLKLDVDWSALPPRLNPRLVEILRRCLEKSPKKRWHAAADVRVEIELLIGRATVVDEPRQEAPSPPRPLWKRARPLAAGLIVGGIGVGAAMWALRPAPVRPVSRFAIPLPEGQQFTNIGRQLVALSPDGTTLVYVANQRLFVRSMTDLEPREIPGSAHATAVLNPVFSPDGQAIVFYSDGALKRMPVSGGSPITVCPATNVFGVSWDEAGILFGQNQQGILRVSADGGIPEVIVPVDSAEMASHPLMLPGGKAMIYSVKKRVDTWDSANIVVHPLGGERRTLVEGAADARYLSTGHLVYARSGVLLARPFDIDRLQLTGGPVPVVEGVQRAAAAGSSGTAQFAVAGSGTLAYLPGPAVISAGEGTQRLALFDRDGKFKLLNVPQGSYQSPRVSRDGRFVAFDIESDNESAVWVHEVSGATTPRRLTFGGRSRSPVWSPDGQWVAFQSDRDGDLAIFRQRADISGNAARLTKPETGTVHIPQSWSPDGSHLLFTIQKEQESSLWVLSLKDQRQAAFPDARGIRLTEGAFSPDGRWIAYQLSEDGTSRQVFIQPFPATGAKYLVRPGGHPVWTPRGDGLILNVSPVMNVLVPVTTTPRVAFGPSVDIPRRGRLEGNPGIARRNVDVMPDGQSLLGVATGSAVADAPAGAIVVVLNWLDEVARKVPRR
jgi:serine/threonine-protein kinase